MVRTLLADFAALPRVEVWTTRDRRLPSAPLAGTHVHQVGSASEEAAQLAQMAAAADALLLIAPETGGALARRCQLVERAGGRLLSPGSAFVEIAANKQVLAEVLAGQGVPVPRGCLLAAEAQAASLSWPRVVKPVDGCGSQGVRLVYRTEELPASQDGSASTLRCEEYIAGLAASVAVLCGPGGYVPLPAGEQRLTTDGTFAYLGGRLPLAAALNARAQALALAALRALPPAVGYVGIDLVLGAPPDGSGDRVIEINPRLTTSYVGLRAACATNLAAAMLAVASGERPNLRFDSPSVEFSADGTVSVANAPQPSANPSAPRSRPLP
jgi:predicted ATP-grasp superfamily ATP-dependent carboligase